MRRWRFRTRVPFLSVLAGAGLLGAAYVWGVSSFQASQHAHYQSHDLWTSRAIDVVLFLWSFWFGSAIGSFLNVVAWRMPRGQGVGGRSHCPRCLAKLRARDNFPVFGWLALGGRCRTCHLPISPRYPIVEAAVGTSITLVAIGELYQLSLPGQVLHWHGGPLWAPIVDGFVIRVLAFHVVGISVAWAMGLIRIDQHRLPRRLLQIGIGMIAVAVLLDPPLAVVSWRTAVHPTSSIPWAGGSLYVDAAIRLLTSLVAAALIGRSLARAFCPAADPKLDPLGKATGRLIDLIAIVAVPAILIGWQTTPAVVVMASLIAVPIRRWFRRSTDGLGAFALAMPITLSFQLLGWRLLVDQDWWPSTHSEPWVILAWAAAILFVPLWIRDRDQRRPAAPPVEVLPQPQSAETIR